MYHQVKLRLVVILSAALCAGLTFPAGAPASEEKTDDPGCPPQPAQTYSTAAEIGGVPDGASAPPLSLTLPLENEPYARQVRLGPVDVQALLQDDLEHPDPCKRLRIGIGRPVEIAVADGQWNALPDGGYLWTLAVISEQAVALRLHVTGGALPTGGELRFISAASPDRVDGPFTGAGFLGTGLFWSTILPGDTVYVEYRTPAALEAAPASLPFAIDAVQHLYRDPLTVLPDSREGDCHNDVTCYPPWATMKNAVGAVAFVGEEYSLVCTGELLNTLAGDLTPYFLTAGHCIENEEDAQSMVVYWKYQTDTCNGQPPDLPSVPTSTVAELVATSPFWAQDYSLTLIRGEFPPGSYTWSGWTSALVADGTPCSCIHHPDGSYKRISFATKTGGAPAHFIRLDWYDGPTEPGSSGAGAYLDSTKQLVGELCCGPSSCADESYDDFSAFRDFYSYIASWLQGGPDDVLEENDTCGNAVVLAPCTYPEMVLKYADDDWYRVRSSSCGPVQVTLNFTDAFGNIDMKLYDACGGNVVAASTGSGDSEVITLPAGPSHDYWLRVYLAGSVRNTYSLTLTATAGGTVVYPIDAGSIPIPDNNAAGVNHTFSIPDHLLLAGLKVGVRITHTWNGDLRVKLTHNGVTATLIDRPGAPARTFGFNNDGFDVLLDDAAFTAIENYDSGGPMVVGTFRPNEPLSVFNGQDAYGAWTLNVADLAVSDTGTLDNWSLHVPPQEPCECGGDGDVNGDGATDCADFAAFQRCFTGPVGGPVPLGCQILNFNCDQHIDLDDFAEFLNVFTGPGQGGLHDPSARPSTIKPLPVKPQEGGGNTVPVPSGPEEGGIHIPR